MAKPQAKSTIWEFLQSLGKTKGKPPGGWGRR